MAIAQIPNVDDTITPPGGQNTQRLVDSAHVDAAIMSPVVIFVGGSGGIPQSQLAIPGG
jgi:hypothetical protein